MNLFEDIMAQNYQNFAEQYQLMSFSQHDEIKVDCKQSKPQLGQVN